MAAKTNFRGSFTALVTPFKNGSLDEAAFRALVSWQIAEGTNGLVPVGTTGESPTVSHDEHKRVVEWCIDEARGRVPVIAGAGSNSTKEAIELAQHAEKAGANAVLVVTPYYNKPTQEGMYQHFKARRSPACATRTAMAQARRLRRTSSLTPPDAARSLSLCCNRSADRCQRRPQLASISAMPHASLPFRTTPLPIGKAS
jgi:dihydrodipicolinate synthase/N-acetylneuraminate lyase